MKRRVGRFFFVLLLGTVATVIGIVTSMTLTPPGRDLLARVVSGQLVKIVNGTIEIGAISGSFVSGITLEDVVVRDTQGVLLADIPRARTGYSISSFLGGDIALSELELDNPTIRIIKHHNGRMNYEEVLRLGEKERTGPSPLVQFKNVRINDGEISIALPWRPDSSWTAAQRDSALADERSRPGRVIESTPEGYRRVITLEHLTTLASRIRITTPDDLPFTIDLDSLATYVSDPGVTVTDAVGRVRLHGDSAVFSLERGALPNTVVSGGGAVTWPNGDILYDFQLQSPHVDLKDLRWVSPEFPDYTGSGNVVAKSLSARRTEYTLTDLDLGRGAERVRGDLVAILDQPRGLGFRDMDLVLRNFDVDHARAYADTLPFYGTVSGTLGGDGWLDRMRIAVNWDFVDAKVDGRPTTSLTGSGVVGFNARDGLYFDGFRLSDSDIDLGTVQRIAPAVQVPGRLAAVGALTGPMQNVTFRGSARHRDGERPVSAFDGIVRLDTRGTVLAVDLDVALDPLSFEGVRRGFPGLESQGSVSGRLAMRGRLDRMEVDADLSGDVGAIRAQGVLTMLPPRWGADGLRVAFRDLDLHVLRGSGPTTRLNGLALATGVVDTLQAPEGTLEVSLRRSGVREWTIDTLFSNLAVRDSIIAVDTVYAEWQGARAGGSGTLGWAAPHTGQMSFHLAADSLTAFDSLLLAVTASKRDSLRPWQRRLEGSATGALVLKGNLDALEMLGSFDAQDVAFQGYRVPRIGGTFGTDTDSAGQLTLAVQADSLFVQTDTVGTPWRFDSLSLALGGPKDSLDWTAGTGIGSGPRLDGTGWLVQRGTARILGIDSLRANLTSAVWRLLEPTRLVLSDSAPLLDTTRIASLDHSGFLTVGGRLPYQSNGDLFLNVFGLDVRDLYALAGRDTTGIGGKLGADIQFSGTAEEPAFSGNANLSALVLGDAKLPYVDAVMRYGDSRFDGNLFLWRTGEQVLAVEAELPVYLGLGDPDAHNQGGPVRVSVKGDSVDLAIIEPFVTAVDRVGGYLRADVNIGGTWESPSVSGFVEVDNGSMTLTSLGVKWDSLNGRATFAGDSILVDNIRVRSGNGGLALNGAVRLEDLSRPVLNIDVVANQFKAIRDRDFLELTATGRFNLSGPFFGATMTGAGSAPEGVLYFADLLTKDIIDLEDPTAIDLVDTLALRRQRLGAGINSRFVNELRVQDLLMTLGSDFWLRSSEANIKLSGDIRANKVRREYRLDGVLKAGPGTYTLKIGPVSRDFEVQRGSVTYFGTPDLNAGLEIEAEHVVRNSGFEVPVIARISGTLLQPQLTLRSDPTIQPPIPEVDLVSYLIFGVPSSQVALQQQQVVSQVASILTATVSSDIERAIVSDLGLGLDLFEFRPVLAGGGLAGSSALQLAAGWQIGRNLFLRLNAGVCSSRISGAGSVGFGASLDYRLNNNWRLQTSFEPTYRDCRVLNQFQPTNDYQIGFDALWEREF